MQPNESYALSGNGLNKSTKLATSDEKGVLTISEVKTGSVMITW
jgi:hypothetical protein